MNEIKWFVLDVNPEPWAIGPVGVSRTGGKLRPYVGRNAQLAAYQEAVREALGPQEMMEGKFFLTFIFFRNRAEYDTPQARTHRKHEADLTNMQKATEDALQGVFFKNDKDVISVRSIVAEQGPEAHGCIIIGIEKITDTYWDDLVPMSVYNEVQDLARNEPASQSADSNVWPPRGPGNPYS